MSRLNYRSLLTALAVVIALSGCSAAPAASSSAAPERPVPDASVSQPAPAPEISAPEVVEPEPEPTPDPEPVAPSEPAPCKHETTRTVTQQAATCTAQGHANEVCSACGETVASGTLAPLGHDYKTTVTEAACDMAGSRINTCSRCGDTQTEVIAAPGHNWSEAACGTAATCKTCGIVSPTVTDHNWVVKYAIGKPECEHCGVKYPFDKLVVKSNMLDVPILSGTKSITIIEMNYEVRSFEGSFNTQSPCRLDITVNGLASNACTLTRGSHLIAEDGTKITSIYDVHGTTNPVCDGSFTEMFSFDIPSCEGSYTVVFSAQ